MKKFIFSLTFAIAACWAATNVLGAEGIIYGDRTYVPVRGVFDAIGFNIDWDNDTQTATIYNDEHTLTVCRWEPSYALDGSFSSGGRVYRVEETGAMYINLKEAAEGIGAELSWDADTKTTHISYNGKDVYIDCNRRPQEPESNTARFTKGKYYPGTNIPDMGAFFNISAGSVQSYSANNEAVFVYPAAALRGGSINPYWLYLEELGFVRNVAAENYANGSRVMTKILEKDNWYVIIENNGRNYTVRFAPGKIILPGEAGYIY